MKRASYFITACDSFSDLVASEVVMALRERFATLSGLAVGGPALQRAGIDELARFDRIRSNERIETNYLYEQVMRRTPQVAILCGWSETQRELAEMFDLSGVPVVLLPETPLMAGSDKLEHVRSVCGVFTGSEAYYKSLGVAYHYVGCPIKEWSGKVRVTKEVMGFAPTEKLAVFVFERDPITFLDGVELAEDLGKHLQKKLTGYRFVIPVPDGIDWEAVNRGTASAAATRFERSGITFLKGMALEVLSLANVAICDEGSSSLEAAMFDVPSVAVVRKGGDFGQPAVMANHVADKPFFPEYKVSEAPSSLAAAIAGFCGDMPLQETIRSSLRHFKSSLDSFASDEVAHIIGDLAGWDARRGKNRAGYD